jgi:hypothetical protein
MKNIPLSASSQSGQNCPSKPIPWWFARRAARREKKVKGSKPPGLKNPPAVAQVTRPAPAIKPTVPAIKPKPRTYAQVVKEKKTPETRPLRSVQVAVKRVVASFGAELRRLVRDVRASLFPKKKSPEKQKPLKAFVKGKTQKTEFPEKGKFTGYLSQPPRSEVRAGFDFSFDYKSHELKEQARVEWRKLTHRLPNLKVSQGPGTAAVFDTQTAVRLIGLYVTDFGREHFERFVHELEAVVGYTNSKEIHEFLGRPLVQDMFPALKKLN